MQNSLTVRLVTYNILDGGRGREQQIAQILAVLDADVILLQEIVEEAFASNLAVQLKMQYFVGRSNTQRRIAILSRLPICSVSSFNSRLLRHGMLQATLEYAPQQMLTVFGIHLTAFAYSLFAEMYRLRELDFVFRQIEKCTADKIILSGDFNSIASDDVIAPHNLPLSLRYTLIAHGGSVIRRAIRFVQSKKFIDVYRELLPNEKGYTLPASSPNTRLDYFFVNDALRGNLKTCNVITIPDYVRHVSDHLPVMMELQV